MWGWRARDGPDLPAGLGSGDAGADAVISKAATKPCGFPPGLIGGRGMRRKALQRPENRCLVPANSFADAFRTAAQALASGRYYAGSP